MYMCICMCKPRRMCVHLCLQEILVLVFLFLQLIFGWLGGGFCSLTGWLLCVWWPPAWGLAREGRCVHWSILVYRWDGKWIHWSTCGGEKGIGFSNEENQMWRHSYQMKTTDFTLQQSNREQNKPKIKFEAPSILKPQTSWDWFSSSRLRYFKACSHTSHKTSIYYEHLNITGSPICCINCAQHIS